MALHVAKAGKAESMARSTHAREDVFSAAMKRGSLASAQKPWPTKLASGWTLRSQCIAPDALTSGGIRAFPFAPCKSVSRSDTR